jgi:flagellar protein FliS
MLICEESFIVENHVFASRYREVAVKTANPVQLIVILYDAAICSLQEAREHIENKNIEARSHSVNKCISIISELQSNLDLKIGGDIASSLNRLYNYMKTRIFTAHIQQTSQPLEEIESLLQNLRSAWRTLAEKTPEGSQISHPENIPDHTFIGSGTSSNAMPVKSFNVSI